MVDRCSGSYEARRSTVCASDQYRSHDRHFQLVEEPDTMRGYTTSLGTSTAAQ